MAKAKKAKPEQFTITITKGPGPTTARKHKTKGGSEPIEVLEADLIIKRTGMKQVSKEKKEGGITVYTYA